MLFRMICFLSSVFVRLLAWTYRYKYTGVENLQKALTHLGESQRGFLLAVWHEHAIAAILAQIGEPYTILISSSKDGEFVAYIAHKLGQLSVRGSSSRGGKEARQVMQTRLLEGFPIAITVDGPRGPRHQCKPGIVDVARETQVPIVPVSTYCPSPYVFRKSWDQQKLPLPFSRIVFRYGEPLYVPTQLSSEEFTQWQRQVEEAVHLTGQQARQDWARWQQLPSGRAGTRLPRKV